MNGYGRIIYFRAHGDHKPKNQIIEWIQEGRFKNGLMHGYAREFHINDTDEDSYIELGYFKDGQP